jgi:hypothetical protein
VFQAHHKPRRPTRAAISNEIYLKNFNNRGEEKEREGGEREKGRKKRERERKKKRGQDASQVGVPSPPQAEETYQSYNKINDMTFSGLYNERKRERDRQRQIETDRVRQRQTETVRETETDREIETEKNEITDEKDIRK